MINRFIVKQRFLCLLIILLLATAHDLMGGTSGKLRIIVGILFYSVFLKSHRHTAAVLLEDFYHVLLLRCLDRARDARAHLGYCTLCITT